MSLPGKIARLAQPLVRRFYGGTGCILCLHRIVAEPSRLADNRALELTPDALRAALAWLRGRGLEPIALDEIPARLSRPSGRKFFAVTLDDGYRDNLTHALPIFREFAVPFTVSLTTGYLHRTAWPWWYALEEILHQRESLSFSWDGTRHDLPLRTDAQRESAFAEVARLIRAQDNPSRDALLALLHCDTAGQAPLLTWEEARELAADPLVTIGCHTLTHPVLCRLDDVAAREELAASRAELGSFFSRPVRHLAFPFGGASAVGPREFALAAACGFTTAMTTRNANLFPAHAHHLTALPRLSLSGNYPVIPRLAALESGIVTAREYRGRRVIVA